ncbi:unnamed protein product [Prorocentrum cordatum]|uniref:Pre-mRNA-splicing factor SYF2 n=1 Tax=Prorocentrum cordatum TaxID=2364126 RepID=A0ABN9W8D1_9DINO|nr:unnamed protein product [Polarella glacialis]
MEGQEDLAALAFRQFEEQRRAAVEPGRSAQAGQPQGRPGAAPGSLEAARLALPPGWAGAGGAAAAPPAPLQPPPGSCGSRSCAPAQCEEVRGPMEAAEYRRMRGEGVQPEVMSAKRGSAAAHETRYENFLGQHYPHILQDNRERARREEQGRRLRAEAREAAPAFTEERAPGGVGCRPEQPQMPAVAGGSQGGLAKTIEHYTHSQTMRTWYRSAFASTEIYGMARLSTSRMAR